MSWFVHVQIFLMLLAWSVDTWKILVKNIGMLLSEFSGTYGVRLMLACSLVELEMD
jgi:hypothetical protein